MDLLTGIFITPFAEMIGLPDLFFRRYGTLCEWTLYGLIALGFVLIFKASGVFNFAQPILVVLAALALILTKWEFPLDKRSASFDYVLCACLVN